MFEKCLITTDIYKKYLKETGDVRNIHWLFETYKKIREEYDISVKLETSIEKLTQKNFNKSKKIWEEAARNFDDIFDPFLTQIYPNLRLNLLLEIRSIFPDSISILIHVSQPGEGLIPFIRSL